jgi:hypothetical protein
LATATDQALAPERRIDLATKDTKTSCFVLFVAHTQATRSFWNPDMRNVNFDNMLAGMTQERVISDLSTN